MEQRAFPRTGDPGYTRKGVKRDLHIQVFEVVFVGIGNDDIIPGLPPVSGNLNPLFVPHIPGSERWREFEKSRHLACKDHFTAVLSSSWTEVDDVFCGFDYLRVVFDDHYRVPHVLQGLQDLDQAVIVTSMESNARFIQHKERSDKRCAQSGGKVDPLGFPAAESERHAVEGYVVQPHFQKKF